MMIMRILNIGNFIIILIHEWGGSMKGIKDCPSCCSAVHVVLSERELSGKVVRYYFVHCDTSGEGTKEASDSIDILRISWRSLDCEHKVSFY